MNRLTLLALVTLLALPGSGDPVTGPAGVYTVTTTGPTRVTSGEGWVKIEWEVEPVVPAPPNPTKPPEPAKPDPPPVAPPPAPTPAVSLPTLTGSSVDAGGLRHRQGRQLPARAASDPAPPGQGRFGIDRRGTQGHA
jgi:hypothetical protein